MTVKSSSFRSCSSIDIHLWLLFIIIFWVIIYSQALSIGFWFFIHSLNTGELNFPKLYLFQANSFLMQYSLHWRWYLNFNLILFLFINYRFARSLYSMWWLFFLFPPIAQKLSSYSGCSAIFIYLTIHSLSLALDLMLGVFWFLFIMFMFDGIVIISLIVLIHIMMLTI